MDDSAELLTKLERIAHEASVSLSDTQIHQVAAYLRALQRWNRTINLTALMLDGFPEPTLDRLVREPIEACSLVSAREGRWYDFGSGGGSPAVPMAVVLDKLELVMVESRARKAAFLREAARAVGSTSATVISDRIETLLSTEPAGRASLISLRAVRIDRSVAAAVRHLLSDAGEVLLFGSVDWSALAQHFEVKAAKGAGVVFVRSVPRGTHASALPPEVPSGTSSGARNQPRTDT